MGYAEDDWYPLMVDRGFVILVLAFAMAWVPIWMQVYNKGPKLMTLDEDKEQTKDKEVKKEETKKKEEDMMKKNR